nr:MAG TPA: hypothetical protein [Caudoviricetes sp.]
MRYIFFKTKNGKTAPYKLGLIEHPPPLYHTPLNL